jgi:hypothetical protein
VTRAQSRGAGVTTLSHRATVKLKGRAATELRRRTADGPGPPGFSDEPARATGPGPGQCVTPSRGPGAAVPVPPADRGRLGCSCDRRGSRSCITQAGAAVCDSSGRAGRAATAIPADTSA